MRIRDVELVVTGISERWRKPGRQKLVHICNALEGNYHSFLAADLIRSTVLLCTVKLDGINIGNRPYNLQVYKSTVRHSRQVTDSEMEDILHPTVVERQVGKLVGGGVAGGVGGTSLVVTCVSK